MRKYLTQLFPSLAATIATLILPFILTTYLVVSQYSDRFVSEQNISYADVQSNILAKLFLNQGLIDLINRFTDFTVWAVLAMVVLIALWMFSSARTSMHNHYAEESFKNFNTDVKTWHTHFFVIVALKVGLVVVALYCVLSLVVKALPLLATNTSIATQGYNSATIWPIGQATLYIIGLQWLFITCIKTFKHIRSE